MLQEQLHGLEGQIAERDTEVERLQEQLVQLTEDFRYNLKVTQAATLSTSLCLILHYTLGWVSS